MIVNVSQSITIHSLRIGSMSNSSILQVGSAGMIKGLSNNFNTGGFTGPAPKASPPGTPAGSGPSGAIAPFVPLPSLS